MILIGLTGNIACGKSTVVAMLRELGAAVCDADALVHTLQAPGGAAYGPIIAAYGPEVLTGGQAGAPLDRAALGRIVFRDPQRLAELEGIVHPLVRAEIEAWLAACVAAGVAVAVLDAIKLLEGGWQTRCDSVWVVTAPPEVQLERLMRDRGMSEADAQARIAAQGSQAAKIAQADVVIDNSGTLAETKAQVQAAWLALRPKAKEALHGDG